MIDILYKIKNSQPTCIGEEAAALFSGIVSQSDWVVASSAVFEMDELLSYVNQYLSSLARIEIHGQELLTLQPIHVLYLDEKILQDGWVKMWGLLYANGAVVYSEKEDPADNFLILFMDQSLVNPENIVQIPIKLDEPNSEQ